MDRDKRNLFRLDELSDYKVASDYPDVRGWDVIDADNRRIGEVDDLLVNKAAERVVYLEVEVDDDLIKEGHQTYGKRTDNAPHEILNKDDDNHIIIPIGAVALDEENKKVISNDIHYDTFMRSGRHSKGSDIGREHETRLLGIFYPDDTNDLTSSDNDDFYNRRHFERRNRF